MTSMEGTTVTGGTTAVGRTLTSFMAATSSVSHGMGGPLSRGHLENTSSTATVETSSVVGEVTTPRATAPETSNVGGVTACTTIAVATSVARGVRTSSPIGATTTLAL